LFAGAREAEDRGRRAENEGLFLPFTFLLLPSSLLSPEEFYPVLRTAFAYLGDNRSTGSVILLDRAEFSAKVVPTVFS
jgi:hypothetical protein